MNIERALFLAAALAAATAACGSDDDDSNDPSNNNTGCAVQATFSSIYTNRLTTATCATGGCHNATSASAGLNFQLPQADVLADLVGEESTSEPPKILIVAGDADTSYFFEKLVNPNVGGLLGQMPVGSMLDQCEIDAIERWINAGAAND